MKLLYQGKVTEDETFLLFNLYAVHHERAKTLAHFALLYKSDDELVALLSDPHRKANAYLKEAQHALDTAKAYMLDRDTAKMDYSITQARVHLLGKEVEESAKEAKSALLIAYTIHSQQATERISTLHRLLSKLAPQNPYVLNLGIELGIY